MKIYTKKGDLGKTSIIGQKNIDKDNARIEAYGTIDELNSHIGLLRSYSHVKYSDQQKQLIFIQNILFEIGASLASKNSIRKIKNDYIVSIEKFIDNMELSLKPLTAFVLPGGGKWTSFAQIARTVCRRAERRIVLFEKDAPIDPSIITFINRLSDYLFVLSRYISFINNEKEIQWKS